MFTSILILVFFQVNRFNAKNWFLLRLESPEFIGYSILFLPLNWYLEYLKWSSTLENLSISVDQRFKTQSFFAGIVTGMLTPNMLGNFLGRIYYFERRHRINITLYTFLTNFAQFVTSITFGWLATMVLGRLLNFDMDKSLITGLTIAVIGSYLIYFFADNFLKRLRKRKKYIIDFTSRLNRNRAFRIKILGLSFIRHIVFTIQFAFVLAAFGEELNWVVLLSIWQVYLITTLVPSLFLGKLGIRESISIVVLGAIGINEYAILFSSLIVWFFNLLVPSILGLFLCKKIQLHG